MFKKLLLSFLCFSLLIGNSFTIPKDVSAQGVVGQVDPDVYELWNHKWYSEMDYMAWYKKVYDPNTPESEIFGERYTAAQVQWVIYSVISNLILNLIPTAPSSLICIYEGDVNLCLDAIYKGFRAAVSDSSTNNGSVFWDTISSNPISGIGYLSNLGSKFAIIPTTYAQSSGFGYSTAGTAIIGLWSVLRNLSYAFIVIATIAIAFMIMFQVKLNPQLVISVQSAIPRIISAAVLITFSYAIAGLIVDLMYVAIGLVSMFLLNGGLTQWSTIQEVFKELTENNVIDLTYWYWGSFSGAAWALAKEGDSYGVIATILAILSILSVIINSVKIIMMTIKNFALLLITFVTGPIEIMTGIVSKDNGFGSWIKKMIGYSLYYPILGLMFFLSFFLLFQGGSTATIDSSTAFFPMVNFIGGTSWVPPLSAIGVGSFSVVWIAMSYIVFTEIPKIEDIVNAFISGKSMTFGSGLNEINSTVQKYAVDPAAKAAPGAIANAGKTVAGWVTSVATRIR